MVFCGGEEKFGWIAWDWLGMTSYCKLASVAFDIQQDNVKREEKREYDLVYIIQILF